MVLLSWYSANLKPVSSTSVTPVIFVIARGQSTGAILKRLEQQKFIRSATALDYYLYFSGQRQSFQAGSFKISPSMGAKEIVQTLQHGTLDEWVTIPEGWRAEQIIDQVLGQGLLQDTDEAELYRLFREQEGKLFPDTYLFAKDSTADQILEKMTKTFEQKTSSLTINSENIILASLVEREAKRDEDRPMVAGVLKNRLKIGMALQVDATLQYALASATSKKGVVENWWPVPLIGDKTINSPYNTYKNTSLPPAPICNPGLPSLQAAIKPAASEYLYYISEEDGTNHYAKTLDQHNANVAKYLR